jgi:stalled ribosome alternative rescue factor ArfA
MKKVLIITQLAHSPTRIQGLSKYLPEYGWEPIVLTAKTEIKQVAEIKLQDTRIIETGGYTSTYGKKRLSSKKYSKIRPYLKAVYKYYKEIRYYPDREKNWKPFALKEAEKLLKNEKIDAIISSSSPVISHIIAHELHRRYSIPWVADFRDLWTQNHDYPYGPLRRLFEKRLELGTLSTADALVTVSEPWAKKLGALHKREVYAITNGFDPDKMSNGKADLTSKFTITYTGQIYTKQDPSKLLLALRDLISHEAVDSKDVEVRFYGPENRVLEKKITEYQLSGIARQYGVVPREISFEKQRESQLLLLLRWEDPRERGWHSGKIFEYLAAKRPILATGGAEDVITELLNETEAGVDAQTVEDVKDTLKRSYTEYKLKGEVSYQGKVEKINKYSYREVARKFAEVINTVTRIE